MENKSILEDIDFILYNNESWKDSPNIIELLFYSISKRLASEHSIFLQATKEISEGKIKNIIYIFPSIYGDNEVIAKYDIEAEAMFAALQYVKARFAMRDNMGKFIKDAYKKGTILNSLDYGEVKLVECKDNIIICETDDKKVAYTFKGIPAYWSDEANCWRYDDNAKQCLFLSRKS